MSLDDQEYHLEKLASGISGFDLIADGGLPKGRATLVAGTSGGGKTIFACQFLAAGIQGGSENGVFVTCEEPPKDISKNMRALGWDLQGWEAQGKWAFVDASPRREPMAVIGEFSLDAFLARIKYAIQKVNAGRVVIDTPAAILGNFPDSVSVRRDLFGIAAELKEMGVTTVITAERTQEYGDIARFGVEEFVSDNVIILRNVLEEEKRRRTIEILKFRGATHRKGEFPFIVIPGQGIIVLPAPFELEQKASESRVSLGIPDLDRMAGGGFRCGSIILVSGPVGTGKTVIGTEFLAGGVAPGERSLLFAFEESRDQILQNAASWGVDLQGMEQEGHLRLVCRTPESMGLEEHLVGMKAHLDDFQPTRVVVDSLSALESVGNPKNYRQFLISLASHIKQRGITGLFTCSTGTITGGASVMEGHVSSMTDAIILLRYVEIYGEIRRGLAVLRMRGSRHDQEIREFTITSRGMRLGKPFRQVSGILSGTQGVAAPGEVDRIDGLFQEKGNAPE